MGSISEKYRVTVFMPIFHRPEYTKMTLDSLAETTRDIKSVHYLLMVDGDKTETTREAYRDFVEQFEDHTDVQQIPQHVGLRTITIRAFELSRGKFIQKIDNDLLFSEGWLDHMIRTMNNNPKVDILMPNIKNAPDDPGSAFRRGGASRSADCVHSNGAEGGIWMIRRSFVENKKFAVLKDHGRRKSNPLRELAGTRAWAPAVDIEHVGYRQGTHPLFINDLDHQQYYTGKTRRQLEKRNKRKGKGKGKGKKGGGRPKAKDKKLGPKSMLRAAVTKKPQKKDLDPKMKDAFRLQEKLERITKLSSPDFIIIGAQKAGTTSIYHNLGQHPRISCLVQKELHYFDRNRSSYTFRQYSQLFGMRKPGTLIGESTPAYCLFPQIAQRISSVCPKVKLIMSVRNPVDRFFSQFSMEKSRGTFKGSIYDAIKEKRSHLNFVSRGFYIDQIMNYLGFFDSSNLKIVVFDDLVTDPISVYNDIANFLGLAPHQFKNLKIYRKGDYKDRKIPTDVHEQLINIYWEYNSKLFKFLGRDLGWNKKLKK